MTEPRFIVTPTEDGNGAQVVIPAFSVWSTTYYVMVSIMIVGAVVIWSFLASWYEDSGVKIQMILGGVFTVLPMVWSHFLKPLFYIETHTISKTTWTYKWQCLCVSFSTEYAFADMGRVDIDTVYTKDGSHYQIQFAYRKSKAVALGWRFDLKDMIAFLEAVSPYLPIDHRPNSKTFGLHHN
ncbi:hypothetical protein AeNC1_013207 [Aphanomyces euteiches]|nr:hypothetical protein AeNC1_013207 [Aphanomyces euteiches]